MDHVGRMVELYIDAAHSLNPILISSALHAADPYPALRSRLFEVKANVEDLALGGNAYDGPNDEPDDPSADDSPPDANRCNKS